MRSFEPEPLLERDVSGNSAKLCGRCQGSARNVASCPMGHSSMVRSLVALVLSWGAMRARGRAGSGTWPRQPTTPTRPASAMSRSPHSTPAVAAARATAKHRPRAMLLADGAAALGAATGCRRAAQHPARAGPRQGAARPPARAGPRQGRGQGVWAWWAGRGPAGVRPTGRHRYAAAGVTRTVVLAHPGIESRDR